MGGSRDRLRDYHADFADKIIEQIKEQRAPFQKPWKPGERSLPENLRTGERYRGGNSLRLSVEAQLRGYTDTRWGTYRQIAAAGGHVKRGQKGTKILFFSRQQVVPAKDEQGQPKQTPDGEPVYTRVATNRSYAKVYTVFNAEQTDGLPPRAPASPEPEWKAHEQAEAIIDASGVDVRHQAGDRAYYNVRTDQVVLPEPGQFPSAGNYYQTALHELGHATGHPSRLNRDTLGKRFGSPDYAREELRAEIAAMMTGEKIGLGHEPQNGADYIAGWVKALEDDPREIHRAAADAEKISTYLIEPSRERIEQREKETSQEPAREEERERTQEPERAVPDSFNRNIERAAEVALATLRQNGDEDRMPDELIRELENVHSMASQNLYTQETANFRELRGALQIHQAEDESLGPEGRKAVLALAENFRNHAQDHDYAEFPRDLERLDLNKHVAATLGRPGHERDVGPTP